MKTDALLPDNVSLPFAVKTVSYRRRGEVGAHGRVSVRSLREMIARWEIGPDDWIRVEGDAAERRVREYPTLLPLDEMLADATEKVQLLRKGSGRRADLIRELEMIREYAELHDRVFSTAVFTLGWLRYAENPALSRGLFLKAIERGYPFVSVVRNNLAVAQIRLGDSAGRDNLILAANDPQRVPAALLNLAKLLQHLQSLGENTDEIASIKDLLRVARAEWRKAPPAPTEPASFALFLCDGDIPASFATESRAVTRLQGQIEDILAEGEDCLRQGRIEQASAHAARASAEMERAREELARGEPRRVSPLKFLGIRLGRIEKATQDARQARERQGQLDTFRRRLVDLESSLVLKVPPADLVQQAEVLLDSARTDVERAESGKLLRECQGRVARHLLQTANELIGSGEKEVAVGLLRRALALESDVGDEIRLRLASIRRDEIEKEIALSIQAGSFEDARMRVARLRSIHPIYAPLAKRLEAEVNAGEANAILDRIVALSGVSGLDRATVLESQRLLVVAASLHPDRAALRPIEALVNQLGVKFGLTASGASAGSQGERSTAPQAPVSEESGHNGPLVS